MEFSIKEKRIKKKKIKLQKISQLQETLYN